MNQFASSYSWGLLCSELRRGHREVEVGVQGRAAFNTVSMIRRAAFEALGFAYLPEDRVEADVQKGDLVRVLADWCPPRPGYHIYYPSRRQPSPAFALVVDALRQRA